MKWLIKWWKGFTNPKVEIVLCRYRDKDDIAMVLINGQMAAEIYHSCICGHDYLFARSSFGSVKERIIE